MAKVVENLLASVRFCVQFKYYQKNWTCTNISQWAYIYILDIHSYKKFRKMYWAIYEPNISNIYFYWQILRLFMMSTFPLLLKFQYDKILKLPQSIPKATNSLNIELKSIQVSIIKYHTNLNTISMKSKAVHIMHMASLRILYIYIPSCFNPLKIIWKINKIVHIWFKLSFRKYSLYLLTICNIFWCDTKTKW